MELDGRSLLLGAGLFGMVIGATIGLAAGAAYRECADAFVAAQMPGLCDGYQTLRIASFGLVGLSGLATILALVGALRAAPGVRVTWRR